MARVKLRETVPIILNGTGNGTAKIGPISSRETWYPENASVKAVIGSPPAEATCKVYVGLDTSDSNFRDTSFFGSSGDSTAALAGDVLTCGLFVWAVWTGGNGNVQATLTVTGTKEV